MNLLEEREIPGRRLRRLREIAGATQFDVERKAGIPRTRLSLAECGHVQLPDWEFSEVERALMEIIRERAAQFEGILRGATRESVTVLSIE